jgi:hypothetical protein
MELEAHRHRSPRRRQESGLGSRLVGPFHRADILGFGFLAYVRAPADTPADSSN